MELKQIEAKIRAEHPLFAQLVDGKGSLINERERFWEFICAAYDFGFLKGMTYGLEQQAKLMEFALGKIFGKEPLDKGFKKD